MSAAYASGGPSQTADTGPSAINQKDYHHGRANAECPDTSGSGTEWRWEGRIPAWGHTSEDLERSVDHDRLRRYRLSRTQQALQASDDRYKPKLSDGRIEPEVDLLVPD